MIQKKKKSFTFFDRLDVRLIHDKTKTRPLSRLAAIIWGHTISCAHKNSTRIHVYAYIYRIRGR